MSGVLNDCDALLQGASVRIVNPKNADIILMADAPAFHVNASGVADVDTITVTATLYELDGPLTFSAQGATLSNVTDRSATVTYANMASTTAIITASMVSGGVTYSRSCIVSTTQDGASGATAKVLKLTPTEQVFKITKAGVNSPASITLTAAGQNLVGTPSFTVPVGTATLTAGANASQKILTYANMSTDSVTIQVSQDGQTDRVTIIKVREGADGTPGADAISSVLTNESVTLPASSNGTVSSYSGAVCSMKVFQGAVDDTANWAFAYSPASSGSSLTYTGSGGTVSVVTMAAGVDSAYVDITASRTGFASITKRFNVTKSKAGASVTGDRGAGTYYAAGSAWSDTVADAATPGNNVVNDVVSISNGSTFAMWKKWDGAAWVAMGAIYDGSLFVTGSINGAALKAGTVEIRDVQGNLILGAGQSFAQQASANPNLVPSPMGWTTFWGGAYAYRNANTVFNNGEYIGLAPSSTAGTYIAAESPPCGAPAGATVTVSFDASCDSGTRLLSLNFYGPNVDTAQFQTTLTTTFKRYVWTITLPNVADLPKAWLRVWSSAVGSQIIVSNIKVEQGNKATPWCDSVISAYSASTFIMAAAIKLAHIDKASIGSLSALTALLGTVEIGAGGYIRQGMTDYAVGTGMWFGQHNGVNKFIVGNTNNGVWWDGSQLVVKNPVMQLASRTASISSSPGANFSHWRQVSSGYCGSHTASISNPSSPSYSWSITSSAVQATFSISGTTQAQCSVYVSAKGAIAGDSVECTITCVITDGGVSKAVSQNIYVEFT